MSIRSTAGRVELLQSYVDTVLFRDVVERYGVSQVAALRWLTRQCLRNPAGAFSVHRLHKDLKSQGHGVAKDAVHALLGHLMDAFLLSAVPLATESERRRNSNPRKVYPLDPALIGAFDGLPLQQRRGSPDAIREVRRPCRGANCGRGSSGGFAANGFTTG